MKKRLLILYPRNTWEIRNRKSALGSYILCLASILQQSGIEVWINHLPLQKIIEQEMPPETMRIASSPLRKIISSLIPRWVKHIKHVRETDGRLVQFEKNLPEGNVDYVLEFYMPASRLGAIAAKKYNCPLVIVLDAPVSDEYEFFHGKSARVRNHWNKAENESLNAASHVVVYSNPMRAYVHKKTGKDKPVSIHQNVDFTRFEFTEPRTVNDEIVIGFIGSFLSWHRVDLLVDIFERLCDTGVNARLLLLGYGQEWEKIQQQVAASRWTKKIELPGFTDGEELVKQKLRMHVGVMPGSNWYGAPNKIFEYGAAGMAVLAPDTPTITDLFKSNEISLFEWNNANDAFVKLLEIVQSAELRARLQHNLQQHIRLTYSAKNTENFYLGVFKATGV